MALTLTALPLAVWEREGLVAALRKAGLPAADVTSEGPLFWRFSTQDDMPAGFGGLEIYGADALMRSVLTLPPLRGRGIGRAIVEGLEIEARVAKCQAVWLLTSSAREWFGERGYSIAERARAPASIQSSAQFSTLCPASATLMMKRLG
jgi:amino-acid N-acetyltransferase